jgi:predicted  nucleic acid-binding Zn-ribbon protein
LAIELANAHENILKGRDEIVILAIQRAQAAVADEIRRLRDELVQAKDEALDASNKAEEEIRRLTDELEEARKSQAAIPSQDDKVNKPKPKKAAKWELDETSASDFTTN